MTAFIVTNKNIIIKKNFMLHNFFFFQSHFSDLDNYNCPFLKNGFENMKKKVLP